MAIQVVCRGCKKRFQVDDIHAGKTGACPNCQKPIEIPRPEDAVVIHEPENFGPKGAAGRPVLKPVPRTDATVTRLQWILLAVAVAGVLVLAITLRNTLENPLEHDWVLALGSLVLGFPLAIGAYFILRDDELEGYRGRPLLLRGLVCSFAYTGIWALYPWAAAFFYADTIELWHAVFLLLPILCCVAIIPFAAFELDYTSALVHVGFFVVVTALLAIIMGISPDHIVGKPLY